MKELPNEIKTEMVIGIKEGGVVDIKDRGGTDIDLKPNDVKAVILFTNPCVYFMHGGRWFKYCY